MSDTASRKGRPMSRREALAAVSASLLMAACQSIGETAGTGSAALSGPTVATPPEATSPTVPPVPAAEAIFRFDQVLGVPTNKADTLAGSLGRYAKARNLVLVRRGDPTATYRVLGYLSAAGGDQGTNVTYVWDILDAQNQRLHRITGFELADAADADPWAGVDDAVLANVAARTVEGIYAWLNQVPVRDPAAVASAGGTAI